MKLFSLMLILLAGSTSATTAWSSVDPADLKVQPEMRKLARIFSGTWTTREDFAPNDFYPKGAQRKGTAQFTLTTGGTSLIEEVHSNGSAGKLDFMVIIWWNNDEKSYNVFTCGNGGTNPCQLRGSARWEGNAFVNEYELVIRGRRRKWRDTFSEISPGSITLVAAMESDSRMQTMITTHYAR